jgi:long-subunit fatty acid transport protein
MIKKIIISTCLLLSLASFAQEGTSSPYSFYGIGDIRFKGTLESRSMAGVAVEQDSIHLNLENPASYSNLKLTTFSMGGTYSSKNLKTSSGSASTQRTTLDYLAVGLPLGKLGFGFGLVPYSSVGYKIESLAAAETTESSKRLSGKGGLNKVFLGVGYKIKPNFSVGADVQYNFGKIETNSMEFRTGVPVGTQELNTADLSGVNFNIGAMYQTKINKKLNVYSSLNYTVQANLNSANARNISSVMFGSGVDPVPVDSFDVPMEKSEVKLPSKISFAAGIGQAQKWLLGGKIAYQKTAGQENSYNKADNVGYGKYASLSIGGYYMPNYNSFTSYFERVTYRGGLKYEKTGLVINSESINDMGFTLGVGLPMSGSLSNINLGFELGKRGTTNANLVQENYANLSVSFSFNDKWFVKRKFN